MAPARPTFGLPALPEVTGRKVVDQALSGSYKRIRFTSELPSRTLDTFFEQLQPLLDDTMEHLLNDHYELKICSRLTLLMLHKTADHEKEETIHLSIKATPLRDMVDQSSTFESLLESFVQRGSGFRLKEVVSLEWEVCQ